MAARRATGEPGSSQAAATSAGSERQLLAVGDAVDAILLLQPSESDELGDGFVHPLARRPYHRRQLLLSDGQLEPVAVARQLEQALRRASGYVEKDRVGESLVDGPDTAGQQLHDAPQGLRLLVEGLAQRRVGHDDDRGGL